MVNIGEDKLLKSYWLKYKSTLSREYRDRLFTFYFPIVDFSAKKISYRLPNTRNADIDDLVQEGSIGLLEGLANYDLSRKVKFKTYIKPRVIGKMKDYLRSVDFVPRSVRIKSRRHNTKEKEEENKNREGYSSLEDFRFNARSYGGLEVKEIVSLDGITAIIQDLGPDPSSKTVQEDIIGFLLKDINPIEKKIMLLYYNDCLPQLEIGKIIGLSEPSISRIRTKVLNRLKSYFLSTMNEENLKLLLVG